MTGLSGGLLAQYQRSCDINIGTGQVTIALASLIIGETLVGKGSVAKRIFGVILGSCLYRFIVAIALRFNVPAECLKLVSSIIVAVAISLPYLRQKAAFMKTKRAAMAKKKTGRESVMLQLIDVSKTFNPGTVNEKKALSHLNLELQDGDFATIIGSNGAGKSTMFNAICGTFFADEGAVILDGMDITYEKEYKRSKYIGHLFQDPMKGTAPNMSIEENLALAYLRASAVKGKFFSRISQKEKQMFQ